MSGEFQKDIVFDEIVVGDVVVMEVFSHDNTRFIGDYRGTAREKQDDIWYFDGMLSLYKGTALNYRLFRVEPPSELENLRALKKRVTDQIAEKQAKLLEKYEDLDTCSERGWDEGHERITNEVRMVRGEITLLEKLLA